jgi:iron(III) transport system substrate-binding protein
MIKRISVFVSLWFFAALLLLVSDSPGLAQSGTLLKKFEGLRGQEREQKLIDGAKKEGKVVVYSFTAVDQLKPLLEEFHKKYPFITPEHYRANATGVFNKFATESRAGQTLADVIDISAGETHTLA